MNRAPVIARAAALLSFVVAFSGTPKAFAQSGNRPVLQVSVDPQRSANGEPVSFKVSIRYQGNASLRPPRMPVLSDWRVLNSYYAPTTRTTFANGKFEMKQNHEFTWILQPLRTGKLVVPSMDLWIGTEGHYQTAPAEVQIDRMPDGSQRGQAPRQAQPTPRGQMPDDEESPEDQMLQGLQSRWNQLLQQNGAIPRRQEPLRKYSGPDRLENVFLQGEISKTSAFEGEMIQLSYALYEADPNTSNHEFSKFPDFKGFIKEELFTAKTLTRTPVEVNGAPFRRSELFRYVLFPLKAGRLRIGPFVLKADYNTRQMPPLDALLQGNPHDYANGTSYPITKSSKELFVDVKPLPPLPEGMKNFAGGVGNFTLELKGPSGELRVDQPFTVTLTLRGRGNLKVISETPLTLPSGLEPYQTKANYEFQPDADGTKTFEYLVLPRKAGAYRLDPFAWTFFDPEKAQYRTLTADALNLQVLDAVPGAARAEGAPETPKEQPKRWAPPVIGAQRFVRTQDVRAPGLLASPIVWIAQGFFYAVAFALFVVRRRTEGRATRFRNAPWEKTQERILAQKEWPHDQLALLLDQWTRERLAGWIARPNIHSESSRDDFLDATKSRLHSQDHRHLEPLRKFWSELDVLRFTGTGAHGNVPARQLLARAEQILQPILKVKSGADE